MNKNLPGYLICPDCLPRESGLRAVILESENDDILSGHMVCDRCGREYPIEDGIANLSPTSGVQQGPSQSRYEESPMVSSYFWTHFGDLSGDAESTDAYPKWAGLFDKGGAMALDTGCALGRFSFELSTRNDFVIGVDLSKEFIRVARELAHRRSLSFSLITEGRLSEIRTVRLPETWDTGRVEFIVADATALPFPRETFSVVTSLNVLDKVPRPLKHLQETNRVAGKRNARFLFSDPFSWSADSALEEHWLGGREDGPYPGRGMDNVRSLLEGKDGVIRPPWLIEQEGFVRWKIRNHRNHYELIRSEFLMARR